MVWSGHRLEPGGNVALIAAAVTVAAGLLMVSNLRYHSFKGVDFRGRVPFIVIVAAVVGAAVVVIDPPRVLLLLAVTYALSGPLWWLRRRRRRLFGS